MKKEGANPSQAASSPLLLHGGEGKKGLPVRARPLHQQLTSTADVAVVNRVAEEAAAATDEEDGGSPLPDMYVRARRAGARAARNKNESHTLKSSSALVKRWRRRRQVVVSMVEIICESKSCRLGT